MNKSKRFRFLNLNPYSKDTQDCTIRAISLFLDKDWDDVYIDICMLGFLLKQMPSTDSTWREYLIRQGCKMTRLPTHCPMCYTVNDFCLDHPYGEYLLKVDQHVVTVIDGYFYDTWDSGDEVALYYWRKER